MKTLDIEWKHLEKDGDTCLRCAGTGKTLKDVVTEMQARCRQHGVSITLREMNPAIALWLQSTPPAGRVAAVGR